jgi:hypothetical protein
MDHPAAAQTLLADTSHIAGIVRSSSAQAEWLGHCAMARNAQLSPIIMTRNTLT